MVFIERPKAQSVSALGDFAPLPPDQGLCPWIPLMAPPHTPVIWASQLYLGAPTFWHRHYLGQSEIITVRNIERNVIRGTSRDMQNFCVKFQLLPNRL